MEPKFIFFSGGLNDCGDSLRSVERYDCTYDRWDILSELNVARYSHSSCILGMMVYVLAGLDESDLKINSIEKLANIEGPVPSAMSPWQLIQPNESFQPRSNSVSCSWNEREIVILGGVDNNN